MSPTQTPPPPEHPVQDFSQCHTGILRRLDQLDELPALLEPAARARTVAEQALAFFRLAIFEHHQDEERELFPAVLASAEPGAEAEHVQAMAQRLTEEHRDLEARWKRLAPELQRISKGQAFTVDALEIAELVARYRAHAAFEEQEYLPLAHAILSRNSNHLSALALSLHLRHSPVPVRGYV